MIDSERNTEIWTLAEQRDSRLQDVSFELLAWGKKLISTKAQKLCSVLLASEIEAGELQKLIEYGADKVYLITDPVLEMFTVDPYAHVLTTLIEEVRPSVMIASATSTGRTIMPFVSALVHGGLTADCTDLSIDPETGLLLQTRPAIGGNIFATIKTPLFRPQMATVRPRSIQKLPRNTAHEGEVEQFEPDFSAFRNRVRMEKFIPFDTTAASLDSADIVVAGGKGLKNKNNFALIQELADLLGGALGSSRPPVDQGWTSYPMQVGLSGKTISPELYIACGISGTVQHLAGIQTAHHIVAVNNDPNAQILQVSDFAVVADLFEFIPILIGKLKELA